jgi:hypothetical protein
LIMSTTGLAMMGLGTFPYWAVGQLPTLSQMILPVLPEASDWTSRHQLLQPFGLSVLIAGLVSSPTRIRRGLVNLLLGFMVVLNLSTYSGYYIDSLKTRELKFVISQHLELKEARAIAIVDNAEDLNARGRGIRSYEWGHLFERSLGIQVPVSTFTHQFCSLESPDYLVEINPQGGRFRALVNRRASLDVQVGPFSLCSSRS